MTANEKRALLFMARATKLMKNVEKMNEELTQKNVPSINRTIECLPKAEEQKQSIGSQKRWTPENLQKLKAYRSENGTKNAASYFGISEGRVRQLLPTKQINTPVFCQLIRNLPKKR